MKYDIVIGLEVHSELKTKTKAFCGCKNEFGLPPNTSCCPVCLGLPGALPTTNKTALEYTIKAGLALNCNINETAIFERKNYFYPDLSKAYQISQLEKPVCENGYIELSTEHGEKRIRIDNIHMEEDAGKNIHDEQYNCSYVDFNRCGVPLIEIVSKPDISSSDEAVNYLDQIKETLVAIGVTDGKMQEGSLRCDVNVSIKPKGQSELGTRTEMKNLNSFKAVKRAIDFEVNRQINIVESGKKIVQETRRWDDTLGESTSLRSKENSQDYRYFPDRDLLSVTITREYVEELKNSLPMLPHNRRKHYIKNLGLPEYDANVLTLNHTVTNYFENCLMLLNEPKAISNFIMSHVLRQLKQSLDEENAQIMVTEQNLCAIIKMVNSGEISSSGAKTLFDSCWTTGEDALVLVDKLNLKQVSDEGAFIEVVKQIINENPQAVENYLSGNEKAITFFMGQIMKATKGKANPQVINKILKEQLKG